MGIQRHQKKETMDVQYPYSTIQSLLRLFVSTLAAQISAKNSFLT